MSPVRLAPETIPLRQPRAASQHTATGAPQGSKRKGRYPSPPRIWCFAELPAPLTGGFDILPTLSPASSLPWITAPVWSGQIRAGTWPLSQHARGPDTTVAGKGCIRIQHPGLWGVIKGVLPKLGSDKLASAAVLKAGKGREYRSSLDSLQAHWGALNAFSERPGTNNTNSAWSKK